MNASPRRSSPAKKRRGLSPEERAGWNETYERTSYEDLPGSRRTPLRGSCARSRRTDRSRRGRRCSTSGAERVRTCCGSHVKASPRSGSTSRRERSPRLGPGKGAGQNVTFREGDATDLPFADAEFAAALDSGCFHTLPIEMRVDYAEELYRVVRPGGALLLSWIGREETREMGPRHRPSLVEVAQALEPHFIFEATEFRAPNSGGAWSTPSRAAGDADGSIVPSNGTPAAVPVDGI